MDEEGISVISLVFLSSNEEFGENRGLQKEAQVDMRASAWNMCHVFSLLTICVAFLIPITLISRTNSIYYQSYWYEFNFVMVVIMFFTSSKRRAKHIHFFQEEVASIILNAFKGVFLVHGDMDGTISNCLLDLVSILEE